MYFYVYWISYALEAILSLLVIYSIFKLAMAPALIRTVPLALFFPFVKATGESLTVMPRSAI